MSILETDRNTIEQHNPRAGFSTGLLIGLPLTITLWAGIIVGVVMIVF